MGETNLREIDALVAEKVMGWTLSARGNFWNGPDGQRFVDCFAPSTDIAAAWQVVEQMRATHRVSVSVTEDVTSVDLDAYADRDRSALEIDANTVPLSICLAALRAHGIDVEPGVVPDGGDREGANNQEANDGLPTH